MLFEVTDLELANRESSHDVVPDSPSSKASAGGALRKVHETAKRVQAVLAQHAATPSDGNDGTPEEAAPFVAGVDIDADLTAAMRDMADRLRRQAERERADMERTMASGMADQQAELQVLPCARAPGRPSFPRPLHLGRGQGRT